MVKGLGLPRVQQLAVVEAADEADMLTQLLCMLCMSSTPMTKLLVGRDEWLLWSGFSVQLLMSAPVCLLISLTEAPDGPATNDVHS